MTIQYIPSFPIPLQDFVVGISFNMVNYQVIMEQILGTALFGAGCRISESRGKRNQGSEITAVLCVKGPLSLCRSNSIPFAEKIMTLDDNAK
jgi:hypothetical protein